LPTGKAVDCIGGIDVTCIDASTPLVLIRAADLGKSGAERPDELDADTRFLARLEAIRIEAGERMGFRDVARMVIPKPVLLAPPFRGGSISARYFMPHACHKALAITGGVGIATACATPGTIAEQIAGRLTIPCSVAVEHPSGRLEIGLEGAPGRREPVALVVRTARRLFEGAVFACVPDQPIQQRADATNRMPSSAETAPII